MATTAARRTLPFKVNTGVKVGQGDFPQLWVLYSTDNVLFVGSPAWIDATADVRSISTSRGRGDDRVEVDAGSATIVLGNRTRTYDPASNGFIRPLNQWWIREQFTGETQTIFKGYAESYEQSWPGGGWSDAETTVSCADEFKVLALGNLPTTSPPRNSYAEVVAADGPDGYWNMDVVGTNSDTFLGDPGITLNNVGTIGYSQGTGSGGAVLGQSYVSYINKQEGQTLETSGLVAGDASDVTGLAEFTFEGWYAVGTPSATFDLVVGPTANSLSTYRIYVSGSIFHFDARNSSGTLVQISGGPTIQTSLGVPNVWYHVVALITGGVMYLYVNGTAVASAAFSGSFHNSLDAGAKLVIGNAGGSPTNFMWFDELAFYRYPLPAATIANHYQAATQRGFAGSQLPGDRCNSVLDAAHSTAPRNVRTGTRTMTGSYMVGQSPLAELRSARTAENVDAMLFIGRDGTVTFLDAAYRTASPWNTVQATFGDAGGSELPYEDLAEDFSDSFLTNEWNVTSAAPGISASGHVQTASDTSSINRFFKRSESLTNLPIGNDTDAANIAAALLAKTKEPLTRITSITLTTAIPAVTEAAFRLDLGDRIRVLRTPPQSTAGGGSYGSGTYGSGVYGGGGPVFDQILFIQKIDVQGSNDTPGLWTITWAVSPT